MSRFAADQHEAEFVVFCGVHFMAESADILTGPHQQVILPDLNAGCSMADMADLDSVEQVWEELAEVTDIDAIVPITYMNSAAALKAFVGRNGGAVCTSSNARAVLTWALGLGPDGAAGLRRAVASAPGEEKSAFNLPPRQIATGRNLSWRQDRAPIRTSAPLPAGRPATGRRDHGEKVLFFPDQHLGRNTGFQLGFGASDMGSWTRASASAACRTAR